MEFHLRHSLGRRDRRGRLSSSLLGRKTFLEPLFSEDTERTAGQSVSEGLSRQGGTGDKPTGVPPETEQRHRQLGGEVKEGDTSPPLAPTRVGVTSD